MTRPEISQQEEGRGDLFTREEVEKVFKPRFLPSVDEKTGFFRCSYCGYLFEELPARYWLDVFSGQMGFRDESKFQKTMKRSLYIMPAFTTIDRRVKEKDDRDLTDDQQEKVMCGKCSVQMKVRPGGFMPYGYRVEGEYKKEGT